MSSTAERTYRWLEWALWTLGRAVALLAVLWPWVRGGVLLSDDVGRLFVRFGVGEFHVWSSSFLRPLDVLAATIVDQETRSLGPALLLHVPSAVAVAFAIRTALSTPMAAAWASSPDRPGTADA